MIVADIIDDVIDILGRGDKTDAYKRLSEAVTVLSRKGRWNPLIRYIDIKSGIDGTTLTLPREVESVLAVNWNGVPLLGRNSWYQFHLNGSGQFRDGGWVYDNSGMFPTYQDILNPAFLTAICRLKTDLDVPFTVYGYDDNDEVLRYQDADGVWHDGLPIDIHITSDFPYGIPYVEQTRQFVRNFSTIKPSQLSIGTAHQYITGENVILEAVTGSTPSPLIIDTSYFVGKDSDLLVSLYSTREGALSGTGKIEITDTPSSTLILNDARNASVQTKFNSATVHNISTGTRVEVSADVMPAPFETNTTYYASKIDNNNVALHSSSVDATNNTDPIDATDVGNLVVLNAKQAIYPVSFLSFTVNHNYTTGDAISISNASGELPAPLLSDTTYYARYITSRRISIHNNQNDAVNGVNVITLTSAGTGTSSVIKSISSGATVGTAQQITAPSHGLSAGDFVQFLTSGTFPSTEIPPASGTFGTLTQGTVYKVATPLSADTFTITDTSNQAIDLLNTGNGQLETLVQRTFAIGFTGDWETDATNLTDQQAVKLDSDGTFHTTNPVTTNGVDYYIKKVSDDIIELFTTSANTIKASVNTASRYRTGNEVFINTASAHGFATNDRVDVSGIGGTLNGVAATVSLGGAGVAYVQGQVGIYANAAGNQCTIKMDTVAAGNPTVVSISSGGEGFTIGDSLTYVSGLSAGTGRTFTIATVTNGVNNTANVYSQDSAVITVTSATQFKFTGAGLNVITPVTESSGTVKPSPIRVITMSNTAMDIVLAKSVTIKPYDDTLKVSDSTYIEDEALIKFTTTGSLPLPLNTTDDYKVSVDSSGFLSFKTTGDVPVVLLSIGSGIHTVNIRRSFSLVPMTSFSVPNHLYDNGDQVTAQEVGTLPTPLVDETNYYVRSIGDDSIELYDTSAHAINTASTTGRMLPTTSGTGTNQIYQIIANTKVSRIINITKGVSDGYIDLLAYDDGRSTDLTQIGTYHPDETRPQYRRLIVPDCNGCARIRYQVRTFDIKSDDDFIPLESRVALICMIRAMELFRTGNFEEAKKYEMQALTFLREEKVSLDSGQNVFLQFNKQVFNRSQDFMQ